MGCQLTTQWIVASGCPYCPATQAVWMCPDHYVAAYYDAMRRGNWPRCPKCGTRALVVARDLSAGAEVEWPYTEMPWQEDSGEWF